MVPPLSRRRGGFFFGKMGDLIQFKRQPRSWLLRIAPWPAVVLLIAVAVICFLATGS
jgi:hypothetical protein